MKKNVVLESSCPHIVALSSAAWTASSGNFDGTTTRKVGWSWEGGPK